MRTAPLLLLLACAHRGAAVAPAPSPAPEPAEAAEDEAPVGPPQWLLEVVPALQVQDVATALYLLDQTLDRPDLTPQERTLALWYRASARAWAGDQGGEILDLRAFVSAASQLDVAGDAVGVQLLHRVALAQLAVLADDARLDGSIGATPERAIPLILASDAGFFLGRLSCGPDGDGSYQILDEALMPDGEVTIEQIDLQCDADRGRRMVYFDLSDWFDLLRFGLGAGPVPEGLTEEGARALLEIGQEQDQGG